MEFQEIRRRFQAIEPDETMFAGMTVEDIAHFETLLAEADPVMASRAVFALSRIGGDSAARVLRRAAVDSRSPVRVAVAAAVAQRPITLPDRELNALLSDRDAGVRKFALGAVKADNGTIVKEALTRMSQSADELPALKARALEALRRLP